MQIHVIMIRFLKKLELENKPQSLVSSGYFEIYPNVFKLFGFLTFKPDFEYAATFSTEAEKFNKVFISKGNIRFLINPYSTK
jgi:hypothetical protein